MACCAKGEDEIVSAHLPEMIPLAFVRSAAVYFPRGKQAKFSLIIQSKKRRPNGVPFIRLMRLVPGSKAQNQNDNF
jgi:hypothetical protein